MSLTIPRPSLSRAASSHSHSHSHTHTTSDASGHEQQDEMTLLRNALTGNGDAGSRITLIGLFSNIGLVGVKGVAGWSVKSSS